MDSWTNLNIKYLIFFLIFLKKKHHGIIDYIPNMIRKNKQILSNQPNFTKENKTKPLIVWNCKSKNIEKLILSIDKWINTDNYFIFRLFYFKLIVLNNIKNLLEFRIQIINWSNSDNKLALVKQPFHSPNYISLNSYLIIIKTFIFLKITNVNSINISNKLITNNTRIQLLTILIFCPIN